MVTLACYIRCVFRMKHFPSSTRTFCALEASTFRPLFYSFEWICIRKLGANLLFLYLTDRYTDVRTISNIIRVTFSFRSSSFVVPIPFESKIQLVHYYRKCYIQQLGMLFWVSAYHDNSRDSSHGTFR